MYIMVRRLVTEEGKSWEKTTASYTLAHFVLGKAVKEGTPLASVSSTIVNTDYFEKMSLKIVLLICSNLQPSPRSSQDHV